MTNGLRSLGGTSWAEGAAEAVRLLGPRADDERLALLGVDVMVGAGDVHVAAEDEPPAGRGHLAGPALQGAQEVHLGREVLAAVGDVDRGHHEVTGGSRHNARLEVEPGVLEAGRLREDLPPQVEAHPRVAARPVPVAPVAVQLAQLLRELGGGGLDLLQADHVRPVALQPLKELRLAGADAVDVPGSDGECHGGEMIAESGNTDTHGPSRTKNTDELRISQACP